MRRLFLTFALVGLSAVCQPPQVVHADDIDKLVDVLADKGVITPEEAQKVKNETKEKNAKDQAAGTSAGSPSWTQMFKFKGDFRFRYQNEDRNVNGTDLSRNRTRLRFRLGMEAKVNPKVKVYAGLASGGTDPRSTNQTFDNQFELKDIRLDYAYGEFNVSKNAVFWAGRMKNPIWEPGDILWDTDINPEGAALRLNYKPSSQTEFYLMSAGFSLEETAGYKKADPWMLALQPGIKQTFKEKWALQLAGTYYSTPKVNQSNFTPDYGTGNNTKDSKTGFRKYNYDSFNMSGELAYTNPTATTIPFFGFFGEYHHAFNPKTSNNGEVGGFRLGHAKVAEKMQWNFRYMYVFQGADSWLDFLPDSDRYGGQTGIRGHELLLQFGLSHNFRFDVDYYRNYSSKQPNNKNGNPENCLQLDLNFLF